ncbi:hypothetical protein WR25_20329 [Diploscapter pachys]|uniref:FecR protein domain-containing protein n=1 Tax=Diploscapter pachys TaxID=2018661 RepID=A0A2A2K9R9_9BILA|nr:hypothetical protein WR25_20329 [Diploscapter pachys]
MQTPEHTRAYRQFEQLWDDLAALKQANRPVPLPVPRAPRWRPALATAAALLCAVLAGNLGAGSEAFSQRISASQAVQVAPDKERPLFVDAGSGRVRVVGTGFDVRRGDRELVVAVAHGQVPAKAPPTISHAAP